MNKGFVYQSPESDFPIVAIVFDSDGEVIHGRAVNTIEEGEAFIRSALTELRDIERHINPE
jgi:hypothetical protein